ncbi:MAG: serine/threonine protein kinase [Deltaproteobacteria bacterium]|nr:serine/threonine protein kinase [Deltaproteobacteria bacterium]
MLKNIGKYELIEEVGRGGMAVVFRAIDTSLERQVALKLLHPYLAEDAQARMRLESEARAVASLHHPLIPEVYDFSGKDSEHAYIVTEFVEGVTLAEFLKNSQFTLSECALLVFHRILVALDHAHECGIVHRDLKPENIMITRDGEIRLMDFGISRVIENPGITSTGQILGSPAFMAPEIVRGKIADKKSDIFACGILLYQLVIGELPFKGTNPHAVLVKIAETDYEDPEAKKPQIGGTTARLIRKLLSKNPEDRPQTTRRVIGEVERILGYAGIKKESISSLSEKVILETEKCGEKLKGKVVQSLLLLVNENKHSPLAHQTISRLSYIAPDNEEVEKLWAELHNDQGKFRFRLNMVIPVLTALVVSGAIIFSFIVSREKKEKLHTFLNIKPLSDVTYIPIENDSAENTSVDDNSSYIEYSEDPGVVDTMNGSPPPMKTMVKTVTAMNTAMNTVKPMAEVSAMKAVNTGGRAFRIFPFPQGKVSIFVNNRFAGNWGPMPPAVSKVLVGPGNHSIRLTHPLCYSRTINITEEMKPGKINIRLKWKPARLIVNAPVGSAVAVKTLEGERKTLPGIPGNPLEVVFPPFWDRSNLRVKVIVASKDFATREKNVVLIAGRLLKIPFSSFK